MSTATETFETARQKTDSLLASRSNLPKKLGKKEFSTALDMDNFIEFMSNAADYLEGDFSNKRGEALLEEIQTAPPETERGVELVAETSEGVELIRFDYVIEDDGSVHFYVYGSAEVVLQLEEILDAFAEDF